MRWDEPLVILLAIAVGCLVVLTVVQVVPSLPTLRQAFIGIDVDPRLVGLVRGIVLYLLPLGAGTAVVWVQGWSNPLLVPLAGSAVGLIRLGESALDRWLRSNQNQPTPPPVASGDGRALAHP
jgi:hypothetical protein